MNPRSVIVSVALFAPVVGFGCSSGYTDENVPVKVFTEKDFQELGEQQKKLAETLAEKSANGLAPPGNPQQTGNATKSQR